MSVCQTNVVETGKSETSVALLTPPGRGAIATLLVAGPAAVDCVQTFFHSAEGRPLTEQPLRRIVFGRWCAAGSEKPGEELVVCRTAAARIEIHCHGGNAAAAAIVKALTAAGCTARDWFEVLPDGLQAAAHQALAHAATRRTAAILLDQYHGALRRAIEETIILCDDGQTDRAIDRLREILQYADLGRHLTTPWRVVLVGRPNVGKSSIINALVGYQRAIVFDQAGTTRDVVTATTAVDGWPIELADTAGLRSPENDPGDSIEAASMARAEDALQRADLVVLVFDASQPPDEQDAQLQRAQFRRAQPDALRVANKIDLAPVGDVPPSMLPTIATLGTGIDRLVSAIADRLVPGAPPAEAPVPFAEEQITRIENALTAIGTEDQQTAAVQLRALL